MDRPKLLYIVEAMGGGVFTYIVALTNELVEDFDVYIAYAVRPQTPSNYTTYFDERIHLIKVENFVRSVNISRDIRALCEIKKIASEVKPDIIHLHSSKAGALGRWAFSGRDVPLYYTPHGYSFLMSNQSHMKRGVYKLIETVFAKRYCITISCSEGEHQETLKFTKRAVYVNNGINCSELDLLLKKIKADDKGKNEHVVLPFTVFVLGRICYQKNPVLFNQIAEAMPDIHFMWIGDGELREQLTAPNIEITGWIDRSTALIKSFNADVFLLTSRWEGLPISLLEAMYMKKPCVVSDVIGNHDVIHRGENGFICNYIEEYVKAIKACKDEQCKAFIVNAHHDILGKYNTKVMAQKYVEIYKHAQKK